METIKIPKDSNVRLHVNISSEANVGSNISLDDVVIKKSTANNFVVELGSIENLDNKIVSGVSNFFVAIGDIDLIKRNTIVEYRFKFNGEELSFLCKKTKLNKDMFVAYFIGKIEMI